MRRLIIATTNPGKVPEIRSALGELSNWSLESIPADVPDIEETGKTFIENAIIKAEHYSKYTNELTLADDSGLCVAALGGRPGVHSARYAPDAGSRIKKILEEMRSVPDSRRDAAFYCALAVARLGKTIWTTEGEIHGVITHEPAGTGGFGYDPVFRLPGVNQTMGELNAEDKNRLSARGKAIAELRRFLLSF